jgi:hypothetical protein
MIGSAIRTPAVVVGSFHCGTSFPALQTLE